jgi:hypothetical protein
MGLGRARNLVSGVPALPEQVPVASGFIYVNDVDMIYKLNPAGAVTLDTGAVIKAATRMPGRRIQLVGSHDTNTVTLTRTAVASAAEGTVALGAATRVLGKYDTLELMQLDDGSWTEVGGFVNVG